MTVNNKLALSNKKLILFKLNGKINKNKPVRTIFDILKNLEAIGANVFRVCGCMMAWKFLKFPRAFVTGTRKKNCGVLQV